LRSLLYDYQSHCVNIFDPLNFRLHFSAAMINLKNWMSLAQFLLHLKNCDKGAIMKNIFFASLIVLSMLTSHSEASSSCSQENVSNCNCQKPVLGIERTIIQFRNAGVTNLVDLLDPGHVKMLALGAPHNIYTPSEVAQFEVDGLAHILHTIGFDFRLSNPKVSYDSFTGIRTLQDNSSNVLALMAPLIVGLDGTYNVLYDSQDTRKNDGSWTVRNNSLIVLFSQDGIITSGTATGQSYKAGDLFSYGLTDHLHRKNWQEPENRDHFVVYSLRLGNQPLDSFNLLEVHVPLQYVDCQGRIGYGTDNVYKEVISPNFTQQIIHHVITFLVEDNPPLDCHPCQKK
jgi:hypothetical protein